MCVVKQCTMVWLANMVTFSSWLCSHWKIARSIVLDTRPYNQSHWALWNNSPEWTSVFKWCSNSPSSPLHLQPSLLCVHQTWSWLKECFSLLSSNTSKLTCLQFGQRLRSAWRCWVHEWQKSVPQHLTWYGSQRIKRHIGHSVWKALGGGVTNLQS